MCLLFGGAANGCEWAGAIQAPQQTASDSYRLQIESFAPARPYTVGQQTVTLVGTIRNTGTAPAPDGLVTARLYCLSGLDYLQGDTNPRIPALAPKEVATFKWQVQPTSTDNPLVASLTMEVPGSQPEARVIAIQRLAEPAPTDSPSVATVQAARKERGGAVLENAKVRARIRFSDADVPILFLSSRMAGGWRRVGTSVPLSEVLSAEGGQTPWWEVFKSDEIRTINSPTESSLLLSGGFGLRWRATFALTLRKDSSVIDTRLTLSPLRPMKLSGIRFCPLLAGEGSFGVTVSEQLAPAERGPNTLAAVRWGAVTVGTIWSSAGPLSEWHTSSMTPVEGADYRVLGVEARADAAPTALATGAVVTMHGRLYALSPSASVSDAFKVSLPAKPK